jgi:radical SAM superfamily enzyme YgiQ (UPF0313 family)
MKDTIQEEDLLIDVTKTEIEKRLEKSEKDKELMKEEISSLRDQMSKILEITNQLHEKMKNNIQKREIREMIKKINPDIVGITCMTPTIKASLEISQLTKELSKDIITVFGGPHMSAFPRETLTYNHIDFGVVGEGEIVFPELISALEGKKKFKDVDGLVYKKNKRIKFNPPKSYVKNLDSLPFPARHLLSNEKYFSIHADFPFTTMITSRGCPFNCSYCFRGAFDRIIRLRSPKNVVDEIEACLNMGFKEIWFYDDTFTFNKKHALEICSEILRRRLNFKWTAITRVDCIDYDLLKRMKEAGCYRIRYGVESGNQEILNSMCKGINLKTAENTIKMTKKVGIETLSFFMIGYPGEDTKKIKDTINFAIKSDTDWAMFSNVVPFPNTELLELAYKMKFLKDKDYWNKFVLGKTNKKIPYQFPELDEYIKFAFRRFYLRPKFVFKTILRIRNARQLKRYLYGLWGLIRFKSFEI